MNANLFLILRSVSILEKQEDKSREKIINPTWFSIIASVEYYWVLKRQESLIDYKHKQMTHSEKSGSNSNFLKGNENKKNEKRKY